MEHVYAAIRNIIKAMRHVNTPGLDTVLNQAELHLNAADPEHNPAALEAKRVEAVEKAACEREEEAAKAAERGPMPKGDK